MWKDFQVLQPELSRDELVVQPQYFGSSKIEIDVMFGPGALHQVQLVIKSRPIDEFRGWRVERRISVRPGSRDPLASRLTTRGSTSDRLKGVPPVQADRVLIRAKRLDGSAAVAGTLTEAANGTSAQPEGAPRAPA